jgi:hypothetical protein
MWRALVRLHAVEQGQNRRKAVTQSLRSTRTRKSAARIAGLPLSMPIFRKMRISCRYEEPAPA